MNRSHSGSSLSRRRNLPKTEELSAPAEKPQRHLTDAMRDSLSELSTLMSQLNENYEEKTREPESKLERIKREREQELESLRVAQAEESRLLHAHHEEERMRQEREISELKMKHEAETTATRGKTAGKIGSLRRSLAENLNSFIESRKALTSFAANLLKDVTFAELISLLPEDIRPNTIEIPGMDSVQPMFLLQPRCEPSCALIVRHDSEDMDSVYESDGPNIFRRNHRLAAFHDLRDQTSYKEIIASVCIGHGITSVFSCMAFGTHQGVQFGPGRYFNDLLEQHAHQEMRIHLQAGTISDVQLVWISG